MLDAGTGAGAELPPGVVLPLSAGWSDVGSWDALWQVLPKDDAGTDALASVAVIGAGVFAIAVGVKLYKWIKGAL